MVETISPAVCGTRRRTALALILFAAGSIGVAAAIGLLLGLLGSDALVPVAITLAAAGVLRESGIVRLPVPQSRRQVPERWHHDLPLPVWSFGYGVGLGVGVLTYHPVATFLVVAVAAAASGTTAAVLAQMQCRAKLVGATHIGKEDPGSADGGNGGGWRWRRSLA